MDEFANTLKQQLTEELTNTIKEQMREEVRLEFHEGYHVPEPPHVFNPRREANREGSCDVHNFEHHDNDAVPLSPDVEPQIALSSEFQVVVSLSGEVQTKVKKSVSPIQDLIMVSSQFYEDPCLIAWDAEIFGVDHVGLPLYVNMQDLFKIIRGAQYLNISIIQVWMM